MISRCPICTKILQSGEICKNCNNTFFTDAIQGNTLLEAKDHYYKRIALTTKEFKSTNSLSNKKKVIESFCADMVIAARYVYDRFQDTELISRLDHDITSILEYLDRLNVPCLFHTTCGGEAMEGSFYCPACYRKFKEKSISVRIDNCKNVTVIDYYSGKKYKTDNGFYVRSQQELIIANALFSRKKLFVYEKTVYYTDEQGDTKELHPDFYLPEHDIYIEHWGFSQTDPKYLSEKAYKEKIYHQKHLTVVGTSKEDIENIGEALEKIFEQHPVKH